MIKHRKNLDVVHTRDSETIRTSHWWLSKRGPAFLDPLVQLGDRSIKIIKPYLHKGQTVADIGCGWGHYTFMLADLVGSEGNVFAIDMAEKCILKIQKKAQKAGYGNIVACISTAADIGFIRDKSVDLVFANGLLCSMAFERELAVSEIRRTINPTGKIFLSLGATPPLGYMDEAEWNATIKRFNLIKGGNFQEKWALVSLF